MSDSYTEVSRENIFTRLGNSIGGILVGVLLVIAAFPLLWINEGRAVKTAAALGEITGKHISISSDKVDPANNGKLVYLQGNATTDEVLSDGLFGVSTRDLELQRNVEMFQWVETSQSKTEEKVGGTKETVTTYTYNKQWSGHSVDSSSFKQSGGHQNPAMQYQSESYKANTVTVGAFKLNSDLKEDLGPQRAFPLSQSHLEALPDGLRGRAQLSGQGFYIGEDPAVAQIGDYRITYSVVPDDSLVSILAVQQSDTFAPYIAKSGRSLQFLKPGSVSAEAIVEQSKSQNVMLTWLLRLAGVVVMWIGFCMIAAPIKTLASVIPALGGLVGAAFGTVFFVLSLALSFLVIAIAWLFYRPILASILIAVAVALIFLGIKFFGKKSSEVEAPAVASPPPPPAHGLVPPPLGSATPPPPPGV